MILLMVKFIWMMFEFSAIAGNLIFRSWSKLQRFKITTSFLILSNVNGQSKTDWLGYWLTPIGLKPWQQFDAIQHLQPPTNTSQFCSYRGSPLFQRHVSPLVVYFCTFLNCHDQLKNITYMNCSMPFTKHRLLWHETLIAYPLPFHVSTQVSDYQLGLVIKHSIPVAFYPCKLTSAAQNHTMEKEFLSIVESFKAFHTMLFGCHALTDHHNLTFHTFITHLGHALVLLSLFLEEYQVHFH